MPENEPIETEVMSDTDIQPASSTAVIESAALSSLIETAKKYPRSVAKVMQKMLEIATMDPETAAGCFYKVKRGSKMVEGKGIRLAEIALSCWQNLYLDVHTASVVTTGEFPHVVQRGRVIDVESNTALGIEARRAIYPKNTWEDGFVTGKAAITQDDIQLAVASGRAFAMRDAILRIIPQVITNRVYAAAKRVAVGEASTLSERRMKALDWFSKAGIEPSRVLQNLGVLRIEDITLDLLETLIGYTTAVKDGTAKLDELFPEQNAIAQAAKIKSKEPKESSSGPPGKHFAEQRELPITPKRGPGRPPTVKSSEPESKPTTPTPDATPTVSAGDSIMPPGEPRMEDHTSEPEPEPAKPPLELTALQKLEAFITDAGGTVDHLKMVCYKREWNNTFRNIDKWTDWSNVDSFFAERVMKGPDLQKFILQDLKLLTG